MSTKPLQPGDLKVQIGGPKSCRLANHELAAWLNKEQFNG